MSGSSFGGTIEQVLDNLFKVAIALVVLIVGHIFFTIFGGKLVTSTVSAVETSLATKVESAATDVKAHVTTTASSSPRSSGAGSNRANSTGGLEGLASTVVSAAENVAARLNKSPNSGSSTSEPAAQAPA